MPDFAPAIAAWLYVHSMGLSREEITDGMCAKWPDASWPDKARGLRIAAEFMAVEADWLDAQAGSP
jgi:hypothetical protein